MRKQLRLSCYSGCLVLPFAAIAEESQNFKSIETGEVSERFKEHAWKVCIR